MVTHVRFQLQSRFHHPVCVWNYEHFFLPDIVCLGCCWQCVMSHVCTKSCELQSVQSWVCPCKTSVVHKCWNACHLAALFPFSLVFCLPVSLAKYIAPLLWWLCPCALGIPVSHCLSPRDSCVVSSRFRYSDTPSGNWCSCNPKCKNQ